ncbi:mRNA-capping enzyme subunit beta [Globomyces sp. JEL0801]|nr:mRNA-capping enzyme subunit beta [Globomyces sp. JEL0801]
MEQQKRQRVDEINKAIPPSLFLYKPPADITLQLQKYLLYSINKKKALTQMKSIQQMKNVSKVEIEIEGKLGIITDKHTQRRIQLPVQSETSNNVLFNIKVFKNDRNQCFFKSDMTMAQHACFNQLLNSLVNPNSKVKYVHLREIDQFYNIRGIGKVRQTIDQKSKKNGTDDVMHELEIELTDINEFTNDIQLEGPPSKRVLDTIDAFMNNIRILSRKAK